MRLLRTIAASALLCLLALPAAAQLPPPANSITVRLGPDADSSNKKAYLLVVEATDVTDLYGFGFDFRFPKKLLRWRKGTQRVGDLLSETGAAETTLLIRQKPRGNIVVGIGTKKGMADITSVMSADADLEVIVKRDPGFTSSGVHANRQSALQF